MVVLAQRLVGSPRAVIVIAWGVLIGLVGVVLCDGLLAIAAAIALGLATCIQLILMVALVPLVSSSRSAAPLAAGMFMIGYFLGFVVPLAGGLLADSLASPAMIFAPLILLAALAITIAHRSDNLSFKAP
jgi:cyanate permease